MAKGKSDKLDLHKQHKAEYAASKKTPAIVEVGPAWYVGIEGIGEAGGEAFISAVGAMYSMAFTIKMTSKFAGRDYKVCHLEGLWWGPGAGDFFDQPRDQWCWKLLIRIPEFITPANVSSAKDALAAKGKPPEFRNVQRERIDEGTCVQMLHVGPYSAEPETIAAMRQFAADEGFASAGLHHEIYLSDPRRVPPERLRTILRQPVGPAS